LGEERTAMDEEEEECSMKKKRMKKKKGVRLRGNAWEERVFSFND
jgi:hypothetical protein